MPAVEWPVLLQDMTDALRTAALVAGMRDDDADSFSLSACKAIISSCFAGGTIQVYIPSEKTVERRQRNIEIRRKY
jgi:DNA-binding NarL/FixJ family response regulator